ncbi:hypothetical protein AAZX31_01G222100 [Glycine max]
MVTAQRFYLCIRIVIVFVGKEKSGSCIIFIFKIKLHHYP